MGKKTKKSKITERSPIESGKIVVEAVESKVGGQPVYCQFLEPKPCEVERRLLLSLVEECWHKVVDALRVEFQVRNEKESEVLTTDALPQEEIDGTSF